MNILYLFHYYIDGDGGSGAVNFFINIDKPIRESYLVVCKRKSTAKAINIVEESEINSIKEFLNKQNLLIHYIRSRQSNILEHILSLANKKIPVITTVVQSPAYKRLMLSPFEIKNTLYFVFIDKSAYKNSILSFIPNERKTSIYLMASYNNGRIEKTENIFLNPEQNKIYFGRGSTLAKCPKEMFEVFDRIEVKNKVFRIVGIPEGDNWVRREAAKRANVEVYPQLSPTDWFNMCKTFDVFLYQLPKDSWASIDGTLGLAMCMRKPVVYMGCDAPKERIEHGKSGYIAYSVSEMARFATELGRDYDLRKSIGEKGRERQIELSIENNAEERFHKAYEKTMIFRNAISIPLYYRLKYLLYCYKDIIRNRLNYYWKN